MSQEDRPFNPGDRVIRRSGPPVIGVVMSVWRDGNGRWRSRVHWAEMMTGARRWHGGGPDYRTHVYCEGLLAATEENVVARQVAWAETRRRRAQRRAAAMREIAA
jgi:hypothetical protein